MPSLCPCRAKIPVELLGIRVDRFLGPESHAVAKRDDLTPVQLTVSIVGANSAQCGAEHGKARHCAFQMEGFVLEMSARAAASARRRHRSQGPHDASAQRHGVTSAAQ